MLVHDLRRTAARDFRRQGVSEGEIMKLCGWKARSMFDRYDIIDEADLAAAVAKRFNGKHCHSPRVKQSGKFFPCVVRPGSSVGRATDF